MEFFQGWHRPTVATTVVAVVVLLIAYHLVFHVRKKGS